MIISIVILVVGMLGLSFAAGACLVDGFRRLIRRDWEAVIAFSLVVCIAGGLFSEIAFLFEMIDLYRAGAKI